MVKWILLIGVVLLIVEAAIISEVFDYGYGKGYLDGVVELERSREKEKKDGEKDKAKPM